MTSAMVAADGDGGDGEPLLRGSVWIIVVTGVCARRRRQLLLASSCCLHIVVRESSYSREMVVDKWLIRTQRLRRSAEMAMHEAWARTKGWFPTEAALSGQQTQNGHAKRTDETRTVTQLQIR